MKNQFEMTITQIKPAKKHLKAIYLDDELYTYIDTDIVYENSLKENMKITFDRIDDIKSKSDFKRAKNKALYLLDFRDYSKADMKSKLKKDYDEETAEKVTDFLEELSLIDDERFAKDYASKLINVKGFAKRRAEYELSKKGIHKNIIDDTLENFIDNSNEKIKNIFMRKINYGNIDDKNLKRTVSKLYRMGYSFDDIKSAAEELKIKLPR